MEDNQNPFEGEKRGDVQNELETARREAAENRDKYLRALADSENTRKRLERLCDDRVWQTKKRLVEHLLEFTDRFEDALKYVQADTPLEQGLRLTYQELQKTLDQEGVKAVPSVGKAFDPRIHEAIELANDPGEENLVVREYRKGYMLDGRLLRAARVQVAGNPAATNRTES